MPIENVPWTDIVQAVAAAIQTLVIVAAAIYAYLQVEEAKRARRTTTAIYLAEQVNNPDAARRRRHLFSEIVARIDKPTADDSAILGQVANEYHSLGYLVKAGIIDSETVMGLQGIAIVRAWKAMEPWIKEERANGRPGYADHFEDLFVMATGFLTKSASNDIAAHGDPGPG